MDILFGRDLQLTRSTTESTQLTRFEILDVFFVSFNVIDVVVEFGCGFGCGLVFLNFYLFVV